MQAAPAGIPLRVPVLLGLVVIARRLGAGRAKRRTTSHPVGPVTTEAGGFGQKSQRRHARNARTLLVLVGTAHSREGRRRCCGCPAERIARGAFSCAASTFAAAAAPGTPGANTYRRRRRRRRDTGSRRSHQRRSTYQRAHPFSRSPVGRAERGADRDRL